jgi:hypothetical protein
VFGNTDEKANVAKDPNAIGKIIAFDLPPKFSELQSTGTDR